MMTHDNTRQGKSATVGSRAGHWRGLTLVAVAALVAMGGCLGEEPEGLLEAKPAATTVKMDFFHKPLPEIPLPNDIATRADEESPTKLRINASMLAPTFFERRVRELIDTLDGWGTFQPVTIPFTGPLDIQTILDAHHGDNYDLSNDVVYLINVDRDSKRFGKAYHLDVGNGNYPVVLEQLDGYWKNDPRGNTISILFEETDEDLNGNGKLDPGEDTNRNRQLDPGEDLNGNGVLDPPEDTDADGVLDKPNYLPGANPDPNNLAERADAMMTFFEKETNTLIVKPLVPLDERTTYAVVVTRRLKDANGLPVGSPFKYVNHVSQTEALKPLAEVLPTGLKMDDIAFAFTFTTQSIQANWVPVREGLYGHGVQSHLNDEFPAELASIEPIVDPTNPRFSDKPNVHILRTEDWTEALELLATQFFDVGTDSKEADFVINAQKYIDYHVIGSFNSPQLFQREDAEGNPLDLNSQSWPQDLSYKKAEARSEQLYFWLTVPRKEISARGQGKPAPVVVLGHGYTSNRFEALLFSGYLARHGFAVLAIDNVGHGLVLKEDESRLARLLLKSFGLEPFLDAMLKNRAFDQNNDGEPDSGADFWTSYLFHTRDVVRQSMLDYVQLIRVLRSFDGVKRWDFDLDGDGQPELAGDFDGDGQVDVGLESTFHATGGSLGGFMSSLLGAVEPHITAIAPISGGGGIADLGVRSVQGGVREAFILRAMGPLYTGTLNADTGKFVFEALVPNLNDDETYLIAELGDVAVGDSIVVENLDNGERACGYVSPQGTFRVGIPSDRGHRHRVNFYKGPALDIESTECEVMDGIQPDFVLDQFQAEVTHFGEVYEAGSPLRSVEEGLGLRRANPELRRFVPLGQLVLDPADPAIYSRHYNAEPLVYPNMKESTWTHALIVTTLGDMNVPASGGVTQARAAGFIDYLNPDPRYGKTPNQMLLETYAIEAVHTYKRYTDSAGNGVHIDIENFSEGTDIWGDDNPRLDPPLRLFDNVDLEGNPRGGYSGAIFPFPIPSGQHGFPFPGNLPDEARKICRQSCEGEGCDCNNVKTFDTGNYIFNMLGEYFRSKGRVLRADLCHSDDSCGYLDPIPPRRD